MEGIEKDMKRKARPGWLAIPGQFDYDWGNISQEVCGTKENSPCEIIG